MLKEAFKSAESLLEKRIDEVNSLNVFPVPDGDTGINMYLTLQSATSAIENLSTVSAAEISAIAARGALLGARGNSGVILSQILRGLAKGMGSKERFSASDFAQSLRQASETAYKALPQPVEGTILTVIREASEAALRRVERGADLKQTLIAVVKQAKNAVNMTPELLPTLKEAGVVDAGGKGLFYMFQGMKDCVSEKTTNGVAVKNCRNKPKIDSETITYGYDLQFLIEGDSLPVETMRSKVESLGESVLVVGDEHLVRVHVHTREPQAVIDYCSAKGALKDKICDNMDTQVETFRKRKVASLNRGRRS
jgi:uncharacterized protein